MIVAHPDDESLWGGDMLSREKGWLVVCLTNGDVPSRARLFEKAMRVFGARSMILAFPDRGMESFTDKEEDEMARRIAPLINQPGICKIVTHGPEGEYGHPAHKAVSAIVKRTITDPDRLHYFAFSKPGKELSPDKKQVFELYFNPVRASLPVRSVRLSWTLLKYLAKGCMKLLRIRNYDMSGLVRDARKAFLNPEGIERTDLEHCELSRFEQVAHHTAYQPFNDLLDEVYSARRPPANAREVYLRNKNLFDRHPDRKYLVTHYLPSCSGRTLGVGCHAFNQFDYCCLPDPESYETIDINEKWSVYGSPFKHTVGDFMEYRPGYKFRHIVLFGVMGIPSSSPGDEDRYSLYDRDRDTIARVDELLEPGGTVLLGPDFSIDQSKTTKEKIRYWETFFREDPILKNKYELIEQFRTDLNFVIVCRKSG